MAALENVFISYKRDGRDEELATWLENKLNEKPDVKVWRDQTSIPLGSAFDQEIAKAIQECDEFIIVLSPESVDSPDVLDELQRAKELGKQVIPLLHEKCVKPLSLGRAQHVDFTGSWDDGLAELRKWRPAVVDEILRWTRKAEKWWAAVPIAIVLVALFWFFAPSWTKVSVVGEALAPGTAAIVVHVQNRGGQASMVVEPAHIDFPPDVPVRSQQLRFVGDTRRVIPGHDFREIHLTASGLEPQRLANGAFLDNMQIGALLPSSKTTLRLHVEESWRTAKEQRIEFPAERIKRFVKLKLPSAVPKPELGGEP